MPLLELRTNLKSLKYSDSGTDNPLVTKDINNPPKMDEKTKRPNWGYYPITFNAKENLSE